MIKEAIVKIVNKQDLTYKEAYTVMNEIMSGETTPTQNAAFLAALSTKSAKAETTDEIAGCAAAMRDHAIKVETDLDVFEIVGTGGDNAHSFNISTTSALVCASGGVKVREKRRGGAPRARRMSLSLTRIDAWSAAKVAFMLSIAGGIIQIVAVALLWGMLNVVGVFDQVTQIVSSTGLDAGGFDLTNVFSLGTVLSAVTIFSIVEVVLITVLVVIFTLLYNVVSTLVGGIHVTLGDD